MELRAGEGTIVGQMWGVAHRTTPWASRHTTTNPKQTPGRRLPGGVHDTAFWNAHWVQDRRRNVKNTGRISRGAGTHAIRRTCLQPGDMGPPGRPCVCTCCSIHLTGISFTPLFVVRVRGAPRPMGAPRPPCGYSPLRGGHRPVKGGTLVTTLITSMKLASVCFFSTPL